MLNSTLQDTADFVKKNLTCSGTKVPRVSLYSVVKNKQLVAFTDSKSLILSDVVASLGHKLVRNELLSSVSCLTCARTLTRIYGTFVKLVSKSNVFSSLVFARPQLPRAWNRIVGQKKL